jgi:AraC-like DNA-binding protein
MRLRDRTITLRPGVAMWMRPGGLYLGDHEPTRPLGVSFMHFDLIDRRTGERPEASQLPDEVHELSDTQYADGVLRRAIELIDRPRTAASWDGASGEAPATALIRGLLMDYEAQTLRAHQQPSRTAAERLHREVIAESVARLSSPESPEPSIADLAEHAGYSVDHFSRIFRDVMGQSPRDFQINARIDRARQLLSESSLTVSQIADALGYRDVYFFSRQFKQRTGRSPVEYRRRGPLR